jgi:hypothetical protein
MKKDKDIWVPYPPGKPVTIEADPPDEYPVKPT